VDAANVMAVISICLYFLLLQVTDGWLTVHKCSVVGCNLCCAS